MKNWIANIKTHYKWALALVLISFTLGAVLVNTNAKPAKEAANTESHEGHEHEEEESTTWTCSMHPQIKQDKPGQCPICAMDLIPLESMDKGGGDVNPDELVMTESATKLAELQTSVVQAGSPEKTLHLQGKVQADERKIAKITARFAGRIEKLEINFTGQFVEKGTPLATLYSPDLLAAQQELIQAAKVKNQHPRLYQSAKAKLKLWDLTETQIEKIAQQQAPEPYFQVLAPIGGTVMKRHVAKGAYVKQGSPLFEVADLSSVWVLFDAYESDLPWVQKGDKVTFTMEALPGKTFKTAIAYIDPFLNAQERVTKLRAEVPNGQGHLKPGMFVNGKIFGELEGAENPLLIPKSAVLWTGKRAVVYVKVPDREMPSFLYREITLGAEAGDYYVVADGLEAGEEVVTNGVFKVDAAAQLQGLPSMMNAQGGTTSTGHDHGQMADASAKEGVHTSFRVGGNCSMCKDRIEKAANAVPGVAQATWEQETGILHLNANNNEVVNQVHKAIAQIGHDTEKQKAPDAVYENLPECCLYERFTYTQKGAETTKQLDETTQKQLADLTDAYLKLKDKLVSDKSGKKQAEAMQEQLNEISMQAFKGKAHEQWMTLSKGITVALEKITTSNDIKQERKAFIALSNDMIALVKQFGAGADTLFLQYCPMADNDKGAYWLSKEEAIRNPYFGSMMLTCGEVKNTLTK